MKTDIFNYIRWYCFRDKAPLCVQLCFYDLVTLAIAETVVANKLVNHYARNDLG